MKFKFHLNAKADTDFTDSIQRLQSYLPTNKILIICESVKYKNTLCNVFSLLLMFKQLCKSTTNNSETPTATVRYKVLPYKTKTKLHQSH